MFLIGLAVWIGVRTKSNKVKPNLIRSLRQRLCGWKGCLQRDINCSRSEKNERSSSYGSSSAFYFWTSVSDYASPIWPSAISDSIISLLDRIQTIGTQGLLGIFNSAALPIAEENIFIDSIRVKHQNQLSNLPKSQPLWKAWSFWKLPIASVPQWSEELENCI